MAKRILGGSEISCELREPGWWGKRLPENDLGFIVDNGLSFDTHITETVKKGNRMSGMLMGNINYKCKEIMVPLFKTLVRPVLEYGNPVWNTCLRKHIDTIESVQRRYTKRIFGYQEMDYEERLRSLQLPSLEYRRHRGDLIEMFKITHGMYDPVTTRSLFSLNLMENTRGHEFKLTKQNVCSKKFANFYTNRIVNAWNSLPNDIVTAGTVNAFKNNLDKFYKEHLYKTHLELI